MLDRQAAHHLVDVLRMRSGQQIILFNGDNHEYLATIEIDGKNVNALIQQAQLSNRESPLRITLVQGISRSDRMSLSIQKAVELGVYSIKPVYCKRSVKRANSTKHHQKKTKHWERIIISACEQSGRCVLPKLEAMHTVEEYFATRDRTETGYVLNPAATNAISKTPPITNKVDVLVGPEGGLSTEEVDLATQSGMQAVHVGTRILRTETAGMVALSILQSLFGDL